MKNLNKLFFLISVLAILLLILIANSSKLQEGTVKSISLFENKVEIALNERNETLVIFDKSFLKIKEGDKILFIGKSSEYKNEKQIVIERIELQQ